MKSRKRFRGLALCLLTTMLLTGCGASESYSTASTDMAAEESYKGAIAYGTESYYGKDNGMSLEESAGSTDITSAEGGTESPNAAATNRKLIKTVDMSVETKEFESLMTTLEARVKELGGYIEILDTYNGSAYSGYRSSRDASITLRIPQDRLEEFLKSVSDICNVVRRSDSVEDVTLTYVDMQSHRDALKTEQSRLLELMEQAESLEDILTIEERLTNIRYQLESMESRLRTMDNQVDYSTVYLSVSEVKELTPVEEKTTGERIVEGFVDSLKDVRDDAVDFFVWFVINLPHLVIWTIVIAVIVLIIRKIRRKRKAKKEAAQKELEQKQAAQREAVQREAVQRELAEREVAQNEVAKKE